MKQRNALLVFLLCLGILIIAAGCGKKSEVSTTPAPPAANPAVVSPTTAGAPTSATSTTVPAVADNTGAYSVTYKFTPGQVRYVTFNSDMSADMPSGPMSGQGTMKMTNGSTVKVETLKVDPKGNGTLKLTVLSASVGGNPMMSFTLPKDKPLPTKTVTVDTNGKVIKQSQPTNLPPQMGGMVVTQAFAITSAVYPTEMTKHPLVVGNSWNESKDVPVGGKPKPGTKGDVIKTDTSYTLVGLEDYKGKPAYHYKFKMTGKGDRKNPKAAGGPSASINMDEISEGDTWMSRDGNGMLSSQVNMKSTISSSQGSTPGMKAPMAMTQTIVVKIDTSDTPPK
ncbi:MAG: hypothetical protein WCO51_04270 [bacterium]|jgi:hypothetical protein